MHEGEVVADEGTVRALIASQFPRWADLPLARVPSMGTVNVIYRLGERLCVRLPRLAAWAHGLAGECRWLPWLAPQLPLRIPQPVASGRPGNGYPFPWAVLDWIDGDPYTDELVTDEVRAAEDLAGFVLALRRLDTGEGPPRAGRRPLAELDGVTREWLRAGAGMIDERATLAAWEDALEAPAWARAPVWIHADLLRPNLLVGDGGLAAVIDFGSCGIGDPATDVVAAWATFGPLGRAAYRAALGVDDGTWRRARGIALHQAAGLIPYYARTNPAFAALGVRTVRQILAEHRTGG
jgi:aminoglycoside phosphotransferase (APT) family kinase protein